MFPVLKLPGWLRPALPLALAAGLLPSCSTQYWSASADREVYGILRQKEMKVLGQAADFDIRTPHAADDLQEIEAMEIIGARRTDEARTLDLPEALALSVEHRREYQTEKENLYLTGLALTRARHDFAPRAAAGSEVAQSNVWVDGDETASELSVRSRAGFSHLLKSGGRLAVDLAQDIFRFHLGGGARPSTRFFSGVLTQPLLRGAGPVVTENLTQSERDVVYGVRSFSRFQKRNALEVVGAYYRILQEKDRVRNEYFNYRNLIAFTERANELAKDRLPRFQVDQARQDELRARNRYVLAVNSYRTLVDQFKVTLGLPVGGELLLEDDALRALETGGLTPLPLDEETATAIAIEHRLDLLNEIDRFEDAKRKLAVAADAFKPGLNLFAGLDVDSRTRGAYSNFHPDVYRTRIGLELDLPLDNLEARNGYRRQEIAFERQLRDLSLAIDRIRLDIRSGLRGLALARERYEIQQNALMLANQRVEAVNLLLETDRAETRDLLEARNDQLSARNALTSALIDYHLTRLEFLFDLGVFDPGRERFWVENPDLPALAKGAAAVPPGSETLITPEALFQETPSETHP